MRRPVSKSAEHVKRADMRPVVDDLGTLPPADSLVTGLALPYDMQGRWYVARRTFTNKALPRWEIRRDCTTSINETDITDVIYSFRYKSGESSEVKEIAQNIAKLLNLGVPLIPGFSGNAPIGIEEARRLDQSYRVCRELMKVCRRDALRMAFEEMVRCRMFDGMGLMISMMEDLDRSDFKHPLSDRELAGMVRKLRRELAMMADAAGLMTASRKMAPAPETI